MKSLQKFIAESMSERKNKKCAVRRAGRTSKPIREDWDDEDDDWEDDEREKYCAFEGAHIIIRGDQIIRKYNNYRDFKNRLSIAINQSGVIDSMEWDVDDEELKNLWEEILNDEDLASDVTVTIECPDSYHQMSCDEVCDEAQNLIYSIERKTGIDDLDFDMYY